MKDSHILHLLSKYLLGGRVTLGERAFGQILILSDHPSLRLAQIRKNKVLMKICVTQ